MTAYSITLSPLLSWPALYGLGGAALALVAFLLLRRRRGALLRALAFGALFAALLNPSITREDRRPLKDVVAVVVDRSDSQTIGDRTAQTDRALAQLRQRLDALDNVETRIIEAGRNDTENQGTRLFSALQSGLADVPPERIGAAILITDGVVHDIPASADALGFKAPVHGLITGHEGERDRRIELVEAPRFGIVGKDQTIVARVLDTADSGEPVTLEVRRDGEKVANLTASVGEKIRVPTPIDHAGPNVVELEVAPIANELSTVNNKAVVTIEGVRDKLRVLLVSGEPHQGERMWRNLLKSDANVDLVHFTILRPPEKSTDGTPINELSLIAFPVADLFGRKIRDFDLIIFDRYSSQTSLLPKIYFDNIVSYVRQGGALLLAEGPDYSTPEGLYFSPLNEIAPARPDGDIIEREYRATISPDGERHPVTRGLAGGVSPPAWGPWLRQIGAEPTTGVNILNGADNRPLLVLSRVDKGRVALLLSDQLWLWARGYQGGGPYLDLLRRLAHWLMKEPELEEEALRASAHGKALTIERQSLKGDVPEATVIGPTGETVKTRLAPAAPGLSRATMEVDKFGLYRITDGERQALVSVGPENLIEFQDIVSTTEKLRPLAEETGGTVRRLAAGSGDVVVPNVAAMHAGVS
ncbi:MAG TPA: hypothetical protein VEC58_00165, partial [Roseiarcus sp.]|nr:hypothetical protein [Roseiarcus sp.]